MTATTQQVDKITEIWNKHLDVAKALHELTSDVSNAVDVIASSLAAGGNSSSPATEDPRRTLSTSRRNLRAASNASGNHSALSPCTRTHQRLRPLETITDTNTCLRVNFWLMRGRETYFWQFQRAAIAGTFSARSKPHAERK